MFFNRCEEWFSRILSVMFDLDFLSFAFSTQTVDSAGFIFLINCKGVSYIHYLEMQYDESEYSYLD